MVKVTITTDPASAPFILRSLPSSFEFLPSINGPKINVKIKKDKECLAQRWINNSETVSGVFTGLAIGAAARKSKASLYGALVNTGVSCVGGGTVYSLLRGKSPSWISSPAFLTKCLIAGTLGYYGFFKSGLAHPFFKKIAEDADLITLGGVAVAAGKEIVEGKGNYLTAALCASLGAVGGGLCWDLMTRKYPSAFKPSARALIVPPIIGAWVYPLVHSPRHPNASIIFTVATTVGLHRIISKEDNNKKKK